MIEQDGGLLVARPTRRTVTRAAAWTVPVIAVSAAAPAFAASPCDAKAVTMNWSNTGQYRTPTVDSATYTIPDPDGAGPGKGLKLTITTTFLGSNTQLGDQGGNSGNGTKINDNLLVTSNVGGSSSSSLVLHQSPKVDANKMSTWTTTSNKSVTRFSFDRPVTDLTFTIRDVDSLYNDFWDGLAITGAVFGAAKTNSTYVVGSGALGNPFRAAGEDYPVSDNYIDGNIAITMASVQTFDLHYWNLTPYSASDVDGDQRVFLSNFAMSYKPC